MKWLKIFAVLVVVWLAIYWIWNKGNPFGNPKSKTPNLPPAEKPPNFLSGKEVSDKNTDAQAAILRRVDQIKGAELGKNIAAKNAENIFLGVSSPNAFTLTFLGSANIGFPISGKGISALTTGKNIPWTGQFSADVQAVRKLNLVFPGNGLPAFLPENVSGGSVKRFTNDFLCRFYPCKNGLNNDKKYGGAMQSFMYDLNRICANLLEASQKTYSELQEIAVSDLNKSGWNIVTKKGKTNSI